MDFHKWRFLPTISSSVVIKLTKGISGDHGKGGEGRDERKKGNGSRTNEWKSGHYG